MKINPAAPHRLRCNIATLKGHGWSMERIARFAGVSVEHLRGAAAGGRRISRRRAVALHLKALKLSLSA